MKKSALSLVFTIALISVTPFAFAEFEDTLVIIETNSGNLTIEFFPNYAPNHVENFIGLSESGYYDGIIFHRIIPGFMIQSGDPFTRDLPDKPSVWGLGGHTINGPETKLDAELTTLNIIVEYFQWQGHKIQTAQDLNFS